MTDEEAIWNLQYVDHEDPVFSEAVNVAIAAMRAQAGAEKNDPLTLDELRKMDGEPVWVKFPFADKDSKNAGLMRGRAVWVHPLGGSMWWSLSKGGGRSGRVLWG